MICQQMIGRFSVRRRHYLLLNYLPLALFDSMTNKSPIDTSGNTTQQQLTPEQRKEELTKCILSQFRLCAAGTIGGAGFSVLRAQSGVRPTAWPMLGGAVSLLSYHHK